MNLGLGGPLCMIEVGHTVSSELSSSQPKEREAWFIRFIVSTQIKINQLVRSNIHCGIILRPDGNLLCGSF